MHRTEGLTEDKKVRSLIPVRGRFIASNTY